jgi:K+-transporting ATPase ATPase C chain
MFAHLRAGIVLVVGTVVLCSVGYPLAVLGVGQAFFRDRASGSLVPGPDGRPVGSRLIAQGFQGDEWFHPRPSAVSYDAAASGGSNWGASNPDLRKRVEEQLKGLATDKGPIPADAVTASGSGLDPLITLTNARAQTDRVAAAWVRRPATTPRPRSRPS